MCSGNPYHRGKKVLVFANFSEDKRALSDGGCTQSVSDERMAEELETVRRHFRGEMKTEIYGRIAPNTDAGMVDYVLSAEKATPVAGATVIAEAQGKKYLGVTDRNGRYSITGLPEGVHQVHAELSGFDNRGFKHSVEVKAGGCAVQDIGRWTKNSIEGFVYDQNGEPVRGLPVFLLRTGTKEKFGKEARTDIRGDFAFTEINPGEYRVVVSPAGETADSPYPRITAAPIRVGPTSAVEAITLTLPPPIPGRSIRIHVTRPDGKPLDKGNLTCAQAGKEAEGYPMSELISLKARGVICRALSDRTYRIRLERGTPPDAASAEVLVLPGREDIVVHLKAP